MSGQIFISYRREESRWSARSLYDRLSAHFDRKQIFMDIDAIAPGADFFEAIEKTVGECDVLVAVIGTHWLTAMDEYQGRRLDNPDDLVRMEIATALKRVIWVIPVLVDGALMPRSTDLPDDLKGLVRRNALRVSDTGFNDDCRRLVVAIEQALEKRSAVQRESEQKELLEAERKRSEEQEKRRLQVEHQKEDHLEADETANHILASQQHEKERELAELRETGQAPAERVLKERLDAEQRLRTEDMNKETVRQALSKLIKKSLILTASATCFVLGFAFASVGLVNLFDDREHRSSAVMALFIGLLLGLAGFFILKSSTVLKK